MPSCGLQETDLLRACLKKFSIFTLTLFYILSLNLTTYLSFYLLSKNLYFVNNFCNEKFDLIDLVQSCSQGILISNLVHAITCKACHFSGHLGSSFLQLLHFTDSTDLKDLDVDHKDRTDIKLWNTPSI